MQQAKGVCGAKRASTLPAACRALYIAVEAARRLEWHSLQHVPGHSGDPYNELADTLAKQDDFWSSDIPAAVAHLAQWSVSGDLHWLWLYISATRAPHLWPTLEYGSFIDRDGQNGCPPPSLGREVFFGPAGQGSLDDQNTLPQGITFSPAIVSANVQTLETREDDAFIGRVPYVREQLHTLGPALSVCRNAEPPSQPPILPRRICGTHLPRTSAGTWCRALACQKGSLCMAG